MDNVVIRKGRVQDAADFTELMLYTAPVFRHIFGSLAPRMIENLFRHPKNPYSFNYSYFLEVDGRVAGMTLFYDHDQKTKNILPFILLLIKYGRFKAFANIFSLMKFGTTFGRTKKGDLYSSNSALYPQYRGRGLGEKLFGLSEKIASPTGLDRIVLDVKADNTTAIALRQKLGYRVIAKLPVLNIKGKVFEYIRMAKELKGGS